jgi:hypothetical protein
LLSTRDEGASRYLDVMPSASSLRQMARSQSGFPGWSSPSGVARAHTSARRTAVAPAAASPRAPGETRPPLPAPRAGDGPSDARTRGGEASRKWGFPGAAPAPTPPPSDWTVGSSSSVRARGGLREIVCTLLAAVTFSAGESSFDYCRGYRSVRRYQTWVPTWK